jgi:hypothetical protein
VASSIVGVGGFSFFTPKRRFMATGASARAPKSGQDGNATTTTRPLMHAYDSTNASGGARRASAKGKYTSTVKTRTRRAPLFGI